MYQLLTVICQGLTSSSLPMQLVQQLLPAVLQLLPAAVAHVQAELPVRSSEPAPPAVGDSIGEVHDPQNVLGMLVLKLSMLGKPQKQVQAACHAPFLCVLTTFQSHVSGDVSGE